MPCCRTDGKGNAELLMWAMYEGAAIKINCARQGLSNPTILFFFYKFKSLNETRGIIVHFSLGFNVCLNTEISQKRT